MSTDIAIEQAALAADQIERRNWQERAERAIGPQSREQAWFQVGYYDRQIRRRLAWISSQTEAQDAQH